MDNIQGPNYCWHVDGLDKLKTYGFAIHGCIDGYVFEASYKECSYVALLFNSFSRKLIWLEVACTNNNSSVIAGYYLNAVEKYGVYDYDLKE